MDFIKALHVIAMVCWFSGLFYLPRLFVYHAECTDTLGRARFKIMEHRLYYYIMTPAGLLTLAFGYTLLLAKHSFYAHQAWMHAKLLLVALLIIYHICLGKWLIDFRKDRNRHSSRFYRMANEVPTVILIAVVMLTFVKP